MRKNHLKPALACAVVAGALAVPATASAGTASVAGDKIVYGGDPVDDNLSIGRDGASLTFMDFKAADRNAFTAGTGCSKPNYYTIVCDAGAVTRIELRMQGGSDRVQAGSTVGPNVTTFVDLGPGDDQVDDQTGGRSEIFGGDGVDEIDTYGGNDLVEGGAGNDDLGGGEGDDVIDAGLGVDTVFAGEGVDRVLGGAGPDSIYGGDGDDNIDAGDGNDTIAGNAGGDLIVGGGGDDELSDDLPDSSGEYSAGDVLVGGAGIDTADYAGRFADQPLKLSLDGAANDGIEGENDNVGPAGDIEILRAGSGADELVGSDRGEFLDGGSGDDLMVALGGDDVAKGQSGKDRIDGGAGNDSLEPSSNNDITLGGEGDDDIKDSTGDDRIDGGSGLDTIDAGDGNDIVLARDGLVDQVGCGVGADVAEIDSNDVVNADPGSLCETVRRAAAPAGGGGGQAGGGGLPGAPGPGNPSGAIAASIVGGQKLATALKSGLQLALQVPAAGTATTTAEIDRRTAAKLGLIRAGKASAAAKKAVRIGSGRAVAKAAGQLALRVKFTAKARKKLKRAKKIKVTLVTRFVGSNGAPAVTRRTVTLKR